MANTDLETSAWGDTGGSQGTGAGGSVQPQQLLGEGEQLQTLSKSLSHQLPTLPETFEPAQNEISEIISIIFPQVLSSCWQRGLCFRLEMLR